MDGYNTASTALVGQGYLHNGEEPFLVQHTDQIELQISRKGLHKSPVQILIVHTQSTGYQLEAGEKYRPLLSFVSFVLLNISILKMTLANSRDLGSPFS